jgi:predicted O-linked N-acetylglucosamine transferase (SPINDLY family)
MLTGLGNALSDADRGDEAIEMLKGVVARFPGAAVAHAGLGLALIARRRYGEATAELERAAALAPGDASIRNNLGICRWAAGDVEDAVRSFRSALDLDPDDALARSNLLMDLNYLPRLSRSEVYAEHRAAGARIESEYAAKRPQHANPRDPDRRLRIGYVSGDFCEHAVSFFTAPVLEHHDKDRFEISAFSTGGGEDAVTRRFREYADHWISLRGISDDRAAARLRELGIDILVDLSGHTALNRLKLFARKPAPVQAHWLGYFNTTGMESIDYRITDARLDPPGPEDRYYTERLVRLPLVCAFEPSPSSPEIRPLPCLKERTFTFACLNRTAKVTAEVVETWADILRRVPDSVLQLGPADERSRADILERFARRGIAASRVRFTPKLALEPYLALHGGIDMALDPFPYNGGATSCHSLWMGVPFVALRGDRYMARMGADLLASIGLQDLVAEDTSRYVDIAVDFAARREDLAELRRSLRTRMLESPLGRVDEFTRSLEAAYRAMWRAWCADPAPGFSHRAADIDLSSPARAMSRASPRTLRAPSDRSTP